MEYFSKNVFVNFIEKKMNELRRTLLNNNYQQRQIDQFMFDKYSLLDQSYKKYIAYTNTPEHYFFKYLENIESYKILLYCMYILTQVSYPYVKTYFDSLFDEPLLYEYERINVGYPGLKLTTENTKNFIYFFSGDFLMNKNINDITYSKKLADDPSLNELVRFFILYHIENYIKLINITNDISQNFINLKIKVQSSLLNKELEYYFNEVVDQEDLDEGSLGVRFINEDEYLAFNYTMSFKFFKEEKNIEQQEIKEVYTKNMFFKQAIKEYTPMYFGMDFSKLNPEYIKEYVSDNFSFLHFSFLNINFRGVNKKIVFLGEYHYKPGREVDYIKNEFKKICDWNNMNGTNVKVDFLSESTGLRSIFQFGQFNLNFGVECTDDVNMKTLTSFRDINFLKVNKYKNNIRDCDKNKCFYDVYYNSIDYRMISMNYFMRFADFETFQKLIYIKTYRTNKFNDPKYNDFVNDLDMKISNAINQMEMESIKYRYVMPDQFMVFGYFYLKNDNYVNDLTNMYMMEIRNTQKLIKYLMSNDLGISNIAPISDYVSKINYNTVREYIINDMCNFYNYIYKEYFPYVYYKNKYRKDMKNKIDDLYGRYVYIFGKFPLESELSPLRDFYTNELNIFEYKYCLYLIECMVYVHDGIITNYTYEATKRINVVAYNTLIFYDTALRKTIQYMNIIGVTPTMIGYMDIYLIHNMLLPYDRNLKKAKEVPENNENILVYCGADHARTMIDYFKAIGLLTKDNYFTIENKQNSETLKFIPCFSNFFLK